jgi:hypothetical protein
VAEDPLVTLARLAGGVVLMQGNLGHQVLGQLLVMNTNEAAIAAASVVLAGTTNQRSAVGQMVVRTVVPAVAVRVLFNKQEQRLEQQANRIRERERALIKRGIGLRRRHRRLHAELVRLEEQRRSREAAVASPPEGLASPPESPPTAALASPPASPAAVVPVPPPAVKLASPPLAVPTVLPVAAPAVPPPGPARVARRARKTTPSARKSPAKRTPRSRGGRKKR